VQCNIILQVIWASSWWSVYWIWPCPVSVSDVQTCSRDSLLVWKTRRTSKFYICQWKNSSEKTVKVTFGEVLMFSSVLSSMHLVFQYLNILAHCIALS